MSITLAASAIPPDHVAALVARLRRFTNIMAYCPDQSYTVEGNPIVVKRVGARLGAIPEGKDWKKRAVVVQDAGGPGSEYEVPFGVARVDCLSYASTGLKAAELAALVIAALEPVARRGFRFTEANCAVTDVHQVSGVLPFYDKDNAAHVRAVSFEVRYCMVPVRVA